MMSRIAVLLSFLGTLIAMGCGNGEARREGGLNQPCYSDGTCDAPWICEAGVCECRPGAIIACECSDGREGVAVCEADRSSHTPCDCTEATCTPSCTGRECGDDGCGGSCGSCPEGLVCDVDGQCAEDPSHPPGDPPSLLGLYHLYPVGIVNGPDDVFSFESCPTGFEYTAFVRMHDQAPCVAALHVNANSWVGGTPEQANFYALMAKGVLSGFELKAGSFRSWSAQGFEPYDPDIAHAAAARLSDGTGVFSFFYESAVPPARYPFEYGLLFPFVSGEAVSGLWRTSDGAPYYIAAMASETDEAAFMRLVAVDGISYSSIAHGTRSGDWLHAETEWMLDHEGSWTPVMMGDQPLRYALSIVTGELREWWSGSFQNPDATSSFEREIDDDCIPRHDFGVCDCADADGACHSPLCGQCQGWLPPR